MLLRFRAGAYPKMEMKMATKKASKKITKTAFILSLPLDLPAAKAVEKAKAAGIKGLSETYVYKVRSKAKAGGGGKKKTSAKGKPGSKKAGKLSASDFIRKHPTKTANEIVELGKKKGLKFTASSIYQTRAYDKARSGGSKKQKPGAKSKSPKFQVFPGGGGGSESELKKAALEVGFPRALTVVTELARKFEAVQRQYQALLG